MAYLTHKGKLIIGVMWVETIVALVFVALRIYTRARIVRNVGWDDHLISISMVLLIGYAIACTVAAFNGMGDHASNLGLVQTVKAVKWEIAGQALNIAAIATSKNSVAVFLMRIVTRKLHRRLLWFSIFSTTFVCASCIIFMFTQCTPLESVFNPTIPHTCYLNFTVNAIFSGSYTAAVDFALAIFPWFILWQLNMKRKERLTIAFGLSLGIFAGICGIIRAVELQGISGKADYTYLTVPLILWGSTELLVCIVCASIPGFRPLYKHIRGVNSSSAPYELGDAPSQQLDASTKVDTKNSHIKHTVKGRLRGAFVTLQSYEGHSSETSRRTLTDAANENHSDENFILNEAVGRSDLVLGNGIHKKTEVEVTYK